MLSFRLRSLRAKIDSVERPRHQWTMAQPASRYHPPAKGHRGLDTRFGARSGRPSPRSRPRPSRDDQVSASTPKNASPIRLPRWRQRLISRNPPTLDLKKSPPTPNPLLHFRPSYGSSWSHRMQTNNTPLNDGPVSTPMTPTERFARDAAQSLQLRRPWRPERLNVRPYGSSIGGLGDRVGTCPQTRPLVDVGHCPRCAITRSAAAAHKPVTSCGPIRAAGGRRSRPLRAHRAR